MKPRSDPGITKGATVRIDHTALKPKRAEALAKWMGETGTVTRILNDRAFILFEDGSKWWLKLNQLTTKVGEDADDPD
jgi:hypothetical protein